MISAECYSLAEGRGIKAESPERGPSEDLQRIARTFADACTDDDCPKCAYSLIKSTLLLLPSNDDAYAKCDS